MDRKPLPVLIGEILSHTARNSEINVKTYRVAIAKISLHAKRLRPWKWRYLMSVEHEKVQPGKNFERAVRAYHAHIFKPKKKRNRIAVNLDNVESIANTLEKRLSEDQMWELSEQLRERTVARKITHTMPSSCNNCAQGAYVIHWKDKQNRQLYQCDICGDQIEYVEKRK